MIQSVVSERQARRQEAVEEVTSKWGRQQTIVGPMLSVPYLHKVSETEKDGTKKVKTELKDATFLPDDLQISGNINCEERYRGIFKVPVYSATLDVVGQFARPDLSEWGVNADDVLWDQAHLTVRISDARAISNQVSLLWNDEQLHFLPGVGDFGGRFTGIHVPMKNQLSTGTFRFSYHLSINGSESLFFVPLGRETIVEVKSNWDNPSFQGNWLPIQRTVDKEGFQAKWNIPFLGRNYPQKWKNETKPEDSISASIFGIKFMTPIDYYRMSERSIKYEMLFLSLTFVTLWLFEIIAKLRVHSIQYLLVGSAICIFYLLELSLAEHIGFLLAYISATLSVTVLICLYCIVVLKGYIRSMILGIIILLLYSYLYILLMNQDYALLVGSVCLFIVISIIMYLTRKVDWYAAKS
jgi:inner membrane protein